MKTPLESETLVNPLMLPTAKNTVDPQSAPVIAIDAELLKDVSVTIEARLGYAHMTGAALMALRSGSVVALDVPLTGLVDLHFNGSTIARGEIVAVGDQFGIRIVDIAESGAAA